MVTKPLTPESDPDAKNTITFSVRFSEEQRDLLQRAAERRGWTPTQLIRTAALERAVYVLNTATATRVDYRGLAVAAAALVAGRRTAYTPDEHGQSSEATVVDDLGDGFGPEEYTNPPVKVLPPVMDANSIREFETAAKTGGTEFLAMLVEACKSVSAPMRYDLAEPLDPKRFTE